MNKNTSHESQSDHIPEFTKQELQTAIECLGRGTAGDEKVIKAEDLNDCDERSERNMKDIFNVIAKQESNDPAILEKKLW